MATSFDLQSTYRPNPSARYRFAVRPFTVQPDPVCATVKPTPMKSALPFNPSCGRRSDVLSSFYFEAAKTLDRLDAKQGSIKGVLATLPEKDRKRTAALVIETLKCEAVNHKCEIACSKCELARQIYTDSRDRCIEDHDRGT